MDKNLRNALIIGGVVLAVMVVLSFAWGGYSGWSGGNWGSWGGWGMMGPWMMGGFGGGMGLMGLFWLVVIGVIIWAVVASARGTGHENSPYSGTISESSLDILKRRYARGEINKAEYEEKRKDLV